MISKLSSYLGPVSLSSGSSDPSLVLYLDAGNAFSYSGIGSTWYDLTNLNNDTIFTTVSVNPNPTYSISGGGSFQFGDVDDSFILSATANAIRIV